MAFRVRRCISVKHLRRSIERFDFKNFLLVSLLVVVIYLLIAYPGYDDSPSLTISEYWRKGFRRESTSGRRYYGVDPRPNLKLSFFSGDRHHSEYRGEIKTDFPFVDQHEKNTAPVVPKIVHFVWIYSEAKCEMRFHQYLSLLSAHKIIKPERIILWKTAEPCGKWWYLAQAEIAYIELLNVMPPASVFHRKILYVEHKSDVIRLVLMYEIGGIYMDLDVLAVKSFDELLYYNTTIGGASKTLMCNGILLSAPRAEFIKLWLEKYHEFQFWSWDKHSAVVPMNLAKAYPDLVHVEWDSFHRPSWYEIDKLYKPGQLWDWSTNYAVHLWYRFHDEEHNAKDIKTLNTTMGELFRYLFYGIPGIIR